MANCKSCGRSMPSAISCTRAEITFPDGTTFDRLPYFSEDGGDRCHDCGIAVGGFHHMDPSGAGCDVELCPRCGGQLLLCYSMGTCDRKALFPRT
jgi:hypothetical protein